MACREIERRRQREREREGEKERAADRHRPVVVLGKGHLLKVDMQPLALRGLQNPVTRQIVAVVARETGRDDASHCGILYHTSTGSWEKKKCKWRKTERIIRVNVATHCMGKSKLIFMFIFFVFPLFLCIFQNIYFPYCRDRGLPRVLETVVPRKWH